MKGEDLERFSVSTTNLHGEMPLVAETAGTWHWWPVNPLLMAGDPKQR
jgi:hypothetical protein